MSDRFHERIYALCFFVLNKYLCLSYENSDRSADTRFRAMRHIILLARAFDERAFCGELQAY